ncbi:hypothetical protein E3N88_07854 [Mikania micrantha]|uniref:Uncharacterized protein n=1 Tax=Mikania micrantha TaxID=192012 RepID=A0A5N6PEL0_9ASTR|nr:hypothetical protein E3N88_07854 [Mikania micrantha]
MFTLPESSDEYHTPPDHQSCSETSNIEGQIPPPTNTSAFDAGDGDLLPVDDDEQEAGNKDKRKLPFSMNTQKPAISSSQNEPFVNILNRVLMMAQEKQRSRGGGEEDHEDDIDFLETAMRRGLTLPRPRWWPPEWFKD